MDRIPDGDNYKFHVNSSGILQVKLEEVPSDMRTRIDLYGKSFNGITRKDATNAGDTVTLEIDIANPGWYYIGISDLDGLAHNVDFNWITRKDATNAGDTVTLEIDITNPGWYYIGISDLDGLAHNVEYAFKVLF
jgi:hypothetical protein